VTYLGKARDLQLLLRVSVVAAREGDSTLAEVSRAPAYSHSTGVGRLPVYLWSGFVYLIQLRAAMRRPVVTPTGGPR